MGSYRVPAGPALTGLVCPSIHSSRTMKPNPCLAALALAVCLSSAAEASRSTISLDGEWRIADGKSPDVIPASFPATVPVPGLVNLARPQFPNVDQFISRENLANRVRSKTVPQDWLKTYWKGKVDQDRDYFWYEKKFQAPAARAAAILKVNKAQFGVAVWLNGKKVGEEAGCFTAGHFVLSDAIRWDAENTLVVRVGAHPAVLPDTYPTGSDFEKITWSPGIYDSVSISYCDNPVIETIQVAPRIATSEILVETRVKNHGKEAVDTSLRHVVRGWKEKNEIAAPPAESLKLAAGEEKVVRHTIRIPSARLWSPDDPFLYQLESSTGGDSAVTRFGMREFRFDAATKRAWLNGKICYLRGSNITLHRFFEDPLCRDLPWNEDWVRKLLGELPKKMHWNYFRFCIGPVPDRWLEICDEVGLMVQNEFFVWTGNKGWYKEYSRSHDPEEMIRQYKDWMRDNWNHPSVVVWDANNETKDPVFGEKIIPAVRPLDLSNRAWENSYNRPAGPDDPVEAHPYLMIGGHSGELKFKMTDLETMDGKPAKGSLPSDSNPALINEYGWLWLNRDGTPTLLTKNVYAQLAGENATPRERLDLYAYLLAGKTEYWRAHRHFAGIIHFVYLTGSYPGVYTADHFADVVKLELDPAFADSMGEAFKPLGVYLNFFQPTLAPATDRTFKVMLVNDEPRPADGKLAVVLQDAKGGTLAMSDTRYTLPALGATAVDLTLSIPADAAGKCTVVAVADADDEKFGTSTRSRRRVTVAPAGK